MGFFLNHIYSIWKLHFWRFPGMFCHQKKNVDHQSDQAKMKISDFGQILIFFKYFFPKFSFFELKLYFWDQKLNINIVLSLKTPFLRFSRDSKAKLVIWYFYFMKKVIFFVFAWPLWWSTTFCWSQNIPGKRQKWSFQIE